MSNSANWRALTPTSHTGNPSKSVVFEILDAVCVIALYVSTPGVGAFTLAIR